MSWGALMEREFTGHVRPAGKWSGVVVAGVVMAVVLGAGATIAAGLLTVETQRLYEEDLSLYLITLIALAAGVGATALAALMVPMNLGIEAIAGERERHTLGTLLATPLSDAAIVWAKVIAILGVAALVAALGGLAVWVVLVVMFGLHGLLWGLLAIPAAVVASVVPGFVTVCFAFVFSARAKTVKDAGQKLSYIMLPIFFPLGFAGPILSRAPTHVAITFWVIAAVVLGALAILWPVLAFVRFRRDKLLV